MGLGKGFGLGSGGGGGGGASLTDGGQQVFDANAGQKIFVLTLITLIGLSQVWVDGKLQDYGVDKTTSDTQIEFNVGLDEGQIVTVTGQDV